VTTRSSRSTPGEPASGRTGPAAGAARRQHPRATETADDLLRRIEFLLGNSGRLTLQRLHKGDWQASVLYARGGLDAGAGEHGRTPEQALARLLRTLA